MFESLLVLHGLCTIQLQRKVKGCNCRPCEIEWECCGNVLVNEASFHRFCRFRWLKQWDSLTQSYYAYRHDRDVTGRRVMVYLAREILGLPTGSNLFVGDHGNHDIRDNRLENLRVANGTQSQYNTRSLNNKLVFKGIIRSGSGYLAKIKFKGNIVCFSTVPTDVEAGLMYYYASVIVQKDFRYPTVFPSDKLPTFERQRELLEMVVMKLKGKGFLVGEWELPDSAGDSDHAAA